MKTLSSSQRRRAQACKDRVSALAQVGISVVPGANPGEVTFDVQGEDDGLGDPVGEAHRGRTRVIKVRRTLDQSSAQDLAFVIMSLSGRR